MSKKLIYSLLMLIPVLSAPLALLYCKEFAPKDNEWIVLLLTTIPFINIIFAIVLIVMNISSK